MVAQESSWEAAREVVRGVARVVALGVTREVVRLQRRLLGGSQEAPRSYRELPGGCMGGYLKN